MTMLESLNESARRWIERIDASPEAHKLCRGIAWSEGFSFHVAGCTNAEVAAALPPPLVREFALTAGDFWSIRSTSVELGDTDIASILEIPGSVVVRRFRDAMDLISAPSPRAKTSQ